MRVRSWRGFALALGVAGLYAQAAFGTLGEKEDSVARLQKTYGADRHTVTTQDKFTVHAIASGGLTIREYAGKDGTIFGVAWDGLTQPDLQPLLGGLYADFAQGAQQSQQAQQTRRIEPKPHGRRAVASVTGDKVTVLKWGHMRAAHGKAYVSALLPEGVTADDVR